MPLPGPIRAIARATGLTRARDARRKRQLVREMVRASFADVPVDLDRMPEYRVEQFPESGPLPWLDRPDALEAIADRVGRGELDAAEASVCERWVRDGYVVLEGAVESELLERIWTA